MKRNRKTKIVSTLGPSSSTEETIENLLLSGADVFRLNFSHGTHSLHKKNIGLIRKLEKKYNRPISILVDLQGPKLRIGDFKENKIRLTEKDVFTFDLKHEAGNTKRVYLPHKEIFSAIKIGDHLLLDDGKLKFSVTKKTSNKIDTKVIVGGELSNKKGVSLPDTVLPCLSLTPKDYADLDFALSMDVDWVALSFVQKPEDVAEAKKIISGKANLMSKLEKPSAIKNLSEIIDLSDAIMIARGDLGVELPPETVPGLQKEITRACRKVGKPVIVATQMLESMINSPTPTRAEASDVATAVYDGADAVMLSAETAAGSYPIEAISLMDRIITQAESDPYYLTQKISYQTLNEASASEAISKAAGEVSKYINATAIVTYTTSGSTTLRAAKERPSIPILGLTSSLKIARRLSLVWGVHSVHTSDIERFRDMDIKASKIVIREGLGKKGDILIITAGVPFGTPGATNILRIAWVQ